MPLKKWQHDSPTQHDTAWPHYTLSTTLITPISFTITTLTSPSQWLTTRQPHIMTTRTILPHQLRSHTDPHNIITNTMRPSQHYTSRTRLHNTTTLKRIHNKSPSQRDYYNDFTTQTTNSSPYNNSHPLRHKQEPLQYYQYSSINRVVCCEGTGWTLISLSYSNET